MIGKTTHEMARELLALPDVPLMIEMWCQMANHEMSADMTGYDPDGTAIIWQKPNEKIRHDAGSAAPQTQKGNELHGA